MPGTQQDIGRFFRHSGIYAFGNALNSVGSLLLLPIYTRYLSVLQYGELELFYVISSIASGILSIGISHATLRFYFEYKEQAERNAVVSTNLLASFAISAAGVLPMAFGAEYLARTVFSDPLLAPGLWLVLATLVLELSNQVSQAYLRAREHSVLYIAVSFGRLVVQVAINAVLLIVYDTGVLGVLAGNLVAVFLGWVVLTAFTVRKCGLAFSWSKLVPVLKYSYPFLLSTLVALVSMNLDRILITSLMSIQALGLFALASKFSRLLTELIGEPFSRAYGAFRFSIMDQDNAAEIQVRVVRYLFAAGCLAALVLSYFVEAVLRVMSAREFWDAAELVPLLALGAAIRLVAYPLQTGILYGKQTRHILHLNVIQAVFNAGAGLGLIYWLGAQGACLTALLAAVINVVMTDHYSQRYFPVRYEIRPLMRVLGVTIAFLLLSPMLAVLDFWAALAIKATLTLLYPLVLLKLDILGAEELALSRVFIARHWRRLRGMP